jgi:pseudaminic acid synthase
MKGFTIKDFEIGKNKKVFIIAELSANHNQNFDIAINSLKAIKDCGADAVKIQTYTPDTITFNCDKDFFKIKQGTIWDGKTLYDLYKEAYTPWEWHPKLKQAADDLNLIFFSSPFDYSAVDFLEKLNVPAYKIASFEIVDIPLIEYAASKGKPIIISTGIASLEEINDAFIACKIMSNNQIALLKCTSSYPAPIDEANLKAISFLERKFKVPVGLSDHTLGISVPIAATALGAKIIEKHFIIDRSIGGPDSSFSLEPSQFKQMVDSVREVEKAIGKASLALSEKVLASRKFARSLFAVTDIKAGEIFTMKNIKSIRPADGISPKYLNEILGKKAVSNIERGTPLNWDLIN